MKKPKVVKMPETAVNPSTATVCLSPDLYWKLRTRILEQHALPGKLQQQLEDFKAGTNELLASAGLNPQQSYLLDDATLTARPQ